MAAKLYRIAYSVGYAPAIAMGPYLHSNILYTLHQVLPLYLHRYPDTVPSSR
jgi:hypothetical protein